MLWFVYGSRVLLVCWNKYWHPEW